MNCDNSGKQCRLWVVSFRDATTLARSSSIELKCKLERDGEMLTTTKNIEFYLVSESVEMAQGPRLYQANNMRKSPFLSNKYPLDWGINSITEDGFDYKLNQGLVLYLFYLF